MGNSESVIEFLTPFGVRHIFVRSMNASFSWHRHERFCLGIVYEGLRCIRLRTGEATVPSGGMFFIEPGVSHACDPAGDSYGVIDFTASSLGSIAEPGSANPCGTHRLNDTHLVDPALTRLVRHFMEAVRNGVDGRSLEAQWKRTAERLMSLRVIRYEAEEFGGPRPAAVQRATQLIDERFGERLTLEEIASAAGLSRYHFRRVFLKSMGLTPHEYLLKTRILRARELLAGGLSITETAMETGFADQSHFNRFFKHVMGVPPRRYTLER